MQNIRPATPSDAAAMLSIYAPFILNSAVTFETEVPDTEAFADRIRIGIDRFPWLVSEENGSITGYCYAASYRERAAYRWGCEVSIYIRENHRGTGLAHQLYGRLFEILKRLNLLNAYAIITVPNPQSTGFHRKMGFRETGLFKKAGYKHGQWHDVLWMEKNLSEHISHPAEPIPWDGVI